MNKISVQSLNECFNVDGPNFMWMDDSDFEIISPINLPNPNLDKIWITNGIESMMIEGNEIPEGWYKGRAFKFSKKGRAANLKQLRENNPNAKKYKIKYRDGTEETVTQLSTWARNNGHSYGSIKNIVYRTRHKKEKQFDCYNSSTYYIKEIHKIG